MDFLELLNSKTIGDMANMRANAYEEHIPVLFSQTERLLDVLVRLKQPKRILEIGTAIGFSGILMLKASPNAILNTVEKLSESAEEARKNFKRYGVYERVNIFEGDACEIIPMLTGEYDFIFLDGPKGQYIEFYPYLKELLVKGGVLVADNVLYKGLVENIPDKHHKHITIARNLRLFLETVSNDKEMSSVVLKIGDGVSVSVKL